MPYETASTTRESAPGVCPLARRWYAPRSSLAAVVVMLTLAAAPALADKAPAKPGEANAARKAPAAKRVVRAYPSPFGVVYVVDEGSVRALRFDDPDAADQSVIDLKKPHEVSLEYVRGAALSLALVDRPRRVLVIGMGGGTFTRLIRWHVAGAVTDAVEIDPVVVDVAKEHFFLVPDAKTRVHVTDGAAFLASARGKYDVIFLDAYEGEDIPAHLASQAFFELVAAKLAKGGVAVMNLAVEDEAESGRIYRRFSGAFPACLRSREPVFGNVLVYGSNQRLPDTSAALLTKARAAERRFSLGFDLEPFARTATDCDVPDTTR